MKNYRKGKLFREKILSDEAIKAKEEILNIFNADTSDEAIRRLAILVEKRHTLPSSAQGVVNRLVSKIEGLFQYLDHDIPKTSNQAEQTFSGQLCFIKIFISFLRDQ